MNEIPVRTWYIRCAQAGGDGPVTSAVNLTRRLLLRSKAPATSSNSLGGRANALAACRPTARKALRCSRIEPRPSLLPSAPTSILMAQTHCIFVFGTRTARNTGARAAAPAKPEKERKHTISLAPHVEYKKEDSAPARPRWRRGRRRRRSVRRGHGGDGALAEAVFLFRSEGDKAERSRSATRGYRRREAAGAAAAARGPRHGTGGPAHTN